MKSSCLANPLKLDIFSQKCWFRWSDKYQVQKSGDVIAGIFCTIKENRNLEAANKNRSGKRVFL